MSLLAEGPGVLILEAAAELAEPHRRAHRKRRRKAAPAAPAVMENSPGLCERMRQAHARARAAAAGLLASGAGGLGGCAPDAALQPQGDVLERASGVGAALERALRLAAGAATRGGGRIEAPLECGGVGVLDIINRELANTTAQEVRLPLLGVPLLLPPNSAVVVAGVERWGGILRRPPGGFNAVVCDPPWPSKSVDRKRSYLTSECWRSLLGLSLPALCATQGGAVVCVWVTNDKRHEEWVRRELFPRWGVRFVAMWHWLKVTSSCEPVLPIGHERKPWEPCLIGILHDSDSDAGGGGGGGGGGGSAFPAPEELVLVSVPSPVHSRKPRLDAVLRAKCPSLAEAPLRGLELFGRGAAEGWTVAGDQAIAAAPAELRAELS